MALPRKGDEVTVITSHYTDRAWGVEKGEKLIVSHWDETGDLFSGQKLIGRHKYLSFTYPKSIVGIQLTAAKKTKLFNLIEDITKTVDSIWEEEI